MDPRSDSYGHFFDRKQLISAFTGNQWMPLRQTGWNEANIAQAEDDPATTSETGGDRSCYCL